MKTSIQDPFDYFSSVFYSESTESSLRQGDLIDISKFKKEFVKLNNDTTLDELYPYFFKTYKYAVISSQCCDINKSNSRYKVNCIQLLAVKEWILVLKDWLESKNYIQTIDQGIILIKNNKETVKATYKEIINFLNHNTHINFYYPALKGKVETDYAACADIPISLKITKVYDALLESRVTSVNKEYRHKLSNFLGNLYFRIGMDEFKDINNITNLEEVIEKRYSKIGLEL